jgi:predicted HNH restriction endonuclease
LLARFLSELLSLKVQTSSPLSKAVESAEQTFTTVERKFLVELLACVDYSATAKEMQIALHYAAPLRSNNTIGRIGRKVLKAHGSHPDGWAPGTFEVWTVIADGQPVLNRGFVWQLKPEVVEGLRACGYLVFIRGRSNQTVSDSSNLRRDSTPSTLWEVQAQLNQGVAESLGGSPELRLERLLKANEFPKMVSVVANAFIRNPDVVAEVLFQAQGMCQGCGVIAPFNRLSDGSPYLEVHHRIQLAAGGKDTVENALALCPNCHRKAHHG